MVYMSDEIKQELKNITPFDFTGVQLTWNNSTGVQLICKMFLNGIITFYVWKIAILKTGVSEEILNWLSLRDELWIFDLLVSVDLGNKNGRKGQH